MPPGKKNGFSRREFLARSSAGLIGAGISSLGFLGLFQDKPALAQNIVRPRLDLEPKPVLKVLRWMGFVENDEEIWLANTRRWEMETGGRVVTDFVNWEDVRPRSAMEAALGAGHDIVFGWFDDPHLYPEKLLDLTEVATYVGQKYGGWYPVCEMYGQDHRTDRWIALPVGSAGGCLNYRSGWVEEAGYEKIPADLPGFIKCCQALKKKGHPTGFSLGHAVGDANSWTHWCLWSFGGKAVEADGEVCLNSPETLQALEAARELFETMVPGVENWLDQHNNMAFLSELISVTANGNSIYFASQKNAPKIHGDLMTANFPVGPVGRPTELSLFSLAFVFKHTVVPNAARHYLMFMLEKPQYAEWESGITGFITQSLKDYYHLPVWKKDPRLTPYRECMARMLWNGYEGPLGRASAAAMNEYIIVDMFASACLKKQTPKTAVMTAEKKLARLYGSALKS